MLLSQEQEFAQLLVSRGAGERAVDPEPAWQLLVLCWKVLCPICSLLLHGTAHANGQGGDWLCFK